MNIENMAFMCNQLLQLSKDYIVEDLVLVADTPEYLSIVADKEYIHPFGLHIHRMEKYYCELKRQDYLIMYIYDDSERLSGHFVAIKNATYGPAANRMMPFDRIRAVHPGGKYPIDSNSSTESILGTLNEVLKDLTIQESDISSIVSRIDCRLFAYSVYHVMTSGRMPIYQVDNYMKIRWISSTDRISVVVDNSETLTDAVDVFCREDARNASLVCFKFNGFTIVPIAKGKTRERNDTY